ncbi:tyrosine-type recombinase/integrase [Thiomicrorhabdus lithotrophica]|uniref:Tyrosine-type recombinase/integrase n=1 Tax=Thiomicrorhabdus lithotrophica TaxID=2949997 RepID=A0ABY8CDI5_9GAMM|nr:integrase arm-type DNA-binding domain-containing protein [Thiomicrorhabdus lithotrophica]WEJ62193.1 tyrosine-type recombinase/integrase [Thiomicrorhabdus lithotrophica]
MLNNTQVKNLKPEPKLYRVTDTNGLVIEVKPSGVKAWRYRYRFDGKATMLALGNYPKVTLLEARRLRDEVRLLLDQGINPKEAKAASVAQGVEVVHKPTFGEMYTEWYEHNYDSWTYEYAKDLNERCENHLLIHLKDVPIDDIAAMDMLAVFKKIEARGTLNMLKKVRGYASRVFRYSVGVGKCAIDPTRDLPSDVFKKEKPKSYATTIVPEEIGRILRKISVYGGHYSVVMALKIAPYVFLRPHELAGLRWREVDFASDMITIAASKMKMKREHLVPMSKQVKALLLEVKGLDVGSEYVFPGARSVHNHITAESLRGALRRLGISKDELTTHGFRHMASTLLHEQGWLSDAIERQLSHVEDNKVKGAYNKALHLDVRKEMMQAWADYLDSLV